MKKFFLFILIILLFINVFSLETIKFSTIEIAMNFEEKNPNTGLGAELFLEVFKRAGYNLKFEFYPLQRSNINIEKGIYKAGFGLRNSITENIYYIPILNINRIIFYKKGLNLKIEYNDIKDLKNYTISVLAGGDIAELLKKSGVKIEEASNYERIIKKVYAKRTDIGITPEPAFYGSVQKFFPGQLKEFVIHEKPFARMDAGIAISKKVQGWEKLAKELEIGFEKMKKDGTYLKIVEKYYGKGNATQSLLK